MSSHDSLHDVLVIGAGINGAGVARDAAGRGLSVLLVEQGDIAGATSSWSTKLVHGGLRYLEHYEFRLVRESLAEREVLLRAAPHLVGPLSFVLPHEPHLRPSWMIRAGLFLYDHLGHRETLPASFAEDLAATRWGAGLKPGFSKGFVYADARVDDARLVLANVTAAKEAGAEIRVATRFVSAKREGNAWRAQLVDSAGTHCEVTARAIVNAAGPWVKLVRDTITDAPAHENVRHVKGSHIVVPRVHREEHAYILQNADRRIVFIIPYEERYSLIGTTDVPVTEFERPEITREEVKYLLDLVNAYLEHPLQRSDVVWTFSGVRPLYDDGRTDPSAVTRDYVLKVDAGKPGHPSAPLVSVYGGKLTTYRRLAEHVLRELAPYFPAAKPAWTRNVPLPGGVLPEGHLTGWITSLRRRYAYLPPEVVSGIARRHGSRAVDVLADARKPGDIGRHFGGGLCTREIDYMIENEWVRSGDDVLWRRSKAGLAMTAPQRNQVLAYVGRVLAQGVPR